MFDDFGSKEEKYIPEPELVPVLDALTAVIFFLLLSTTFVELTKITVPPSQTEVITEPNAKPPVSARLYVKDQGGKLSLSLKWAGAHPDGIKRLVERRPDNSRSKELEDTVHELVTQLKAQYPEEKTLQMAVSENTTYQELISVMDGARHKMQDLVLLSPDDVNSAQD